MSVFALLGAGKTGIKVLDLKKTDEDIIVFNSKNPASLEKLKHCDAVISFLPAGPFLDYIPLLLESGLPVIIGTTGFNWPDHVDGELKAKNQTWIYAHNFALSMTIIRPIIELFGKAVNLLEQTEYKLHEVHHTQKLDAPSGTALSWQSWLGQEVEISSERIGDVVGDHELTLRTEFEEITIKHRCFDRKNFASGALWATRYLLSHPEQSAGLINLESIANKKIRINNELANNF